MDDGRWNVWKKNKRIWKLNIMSNELDYGVYSEKIIKRNRVVVWYKKKILDIWCSIRYWESICFINCKWKKGKEIRWDKERNGWIWIWNLRWKCER